MQACALDAGILVLSLHFDVVESACSVFGKHVEDDAPPLEILDIFLRSDIRDLEVGSAENDLDEQRRSFEAVAENFAHESIVNEAEPLDFLPVFFFALCVVPVFPLLSCRLAGRPEDGIRAGLRPMAKRLAGSSQGMYQVYSRKGRLRSPFSREKREA